MEPFETGQGGISPSQVDPNLDPQSIAPVLDLFRTVKDMTSFGVQWNLDLMKCQGTGEICLLY